MAGNGSTARRCTRGTCCSRIAIISVRRRCALQSRRAPTCCCVCGGPHSALSALTGRPFSALRHARRLKVGQVGDWPVVLLDPEGVPIDGRVIATKLPAPVAAKAERRVAKTAIKKSTTADPRSLEAAHFVMVFTTLPATRLAAPDVLELYRVRWQIDRAFKRLKQLLKLGRLPHKHAQAAQGWILAKLVIALLLETLYRNARAGSASRRLGDFAFRKRRGVSFGAAVLFRCDQRE